MRRPTYPRSHRRGFTIVELLVAAALTMFIMYILAACFAAALESFRQVKAVGDMQEKLRSAASTLRRDLMDDHFDRSYSGHGGGPRLSDQHMIRFNPSLGAWEPDPTWQPPTEGFFRIYQGSQAYVGQTAGDPPTQSQGGVVPEGVILADYEGMDEEGVRSTRATDHFLHFTIKRYVQRPSDLFTASIVDPSTSVAPRTRPLDYVTANQLLSQWAEVAYFLVPTGTQANGGLPLFYLVRREKALIPFGQSTLIPGLPPSPPVPTGSYTNVSQTNTLGVVGTIPNNLFNTSEDITAPCRRLNVTPGNFTILTPPPALNYNPPVIAGTISTGYAPLGTGDDIVLTDVLSFEIKVAHDLAVPNNPSAAFSDTPEFPFDYLPQVPTPPSGPGAGYPPGPPYPAGTIPPRYPLCQNVNMAMPGLRIFDTWSKAVGPNVPAGATQAPAYDYSSWRTNGTIASIPLYTRIRALQIRLRVWDAKTQQVRQVTLIQDM